MNCLVTGAAGFIGRHLVRALIAEGWRVTAVTRRPEALGDLSHPHLRVEPLDIAKRMPHVAEGSVVVHLAALRAGAKETRARYLAVNRDISVRLARRALDAKVLRFLNVSTAMIFGPTHGVAVNEGASPQPFAREHAYIASKIAALEGIEDLVQEGFPLVSLFPSIVYGPDHPSSPNRVTSHIRRLLSSPLRLHIGHASARRTLAFVDDVVKGIIEATRRPLVPGSRFILGGEDTSLMELESLVLTLSGKSSRALRLPATIACAAASASDLVLHRSRHEGYRAQVDVLNHEWKFDGTRAREFLDYSDTPLHIGVQKTIQSIETTRR